MYGFEWFGLIIAHLIGDFILQEDWQAKNKINPWPGKRPEAEKAHGESFSIIDPLAAFNQRLHEYYGRRDAWIKGNFACTVHCTIYTLTILLFSFWWLPWWAYAVVFLSHWLIDRFRLARYWMINVSHQKEFATGPLAPWSVIVVDQCAHLTILFLVGVITVLTRY